MGNSLSGWEYHSYALWYVVVYMVHTKSHSQSRYMQCIHTNTIIIVTGVAFSCGVCG